MAKGSSGKGKYSLRDRGEDQQESDNQVSQQASHRIEDDDDTPLAPPPPPTPTPVKPKPSRVSNSSASPHVIASPAHQQLLRVPSFGVTLAPGVTLANFGNFIL